MPEGGLQQLFIVVLFVVVGLIDLFGRWAKGRQGNDSGGSAPPAPTRWPRVEWPDEDDGVDERYGQGRTWRPIDAPPPVEVPAPAKPRTSSQTSPREMPQREPVPRNAKQRLATPTTPTTPSAPRRASTLLAAAPVAPPVQRHTTLLDVREARRAVIAATVLGPCLAMRDD